MHKLSRTCEENSRAVWKSGNRWVSGDYFSRSERAESPAGGWEKGESTWCTQLRLHHMQEWWPQVSVRDKKGCFRGSPIPRPPFHSGLHLGTVRWEVRLSGSEPKQATARTSGHLLPRPWDAGIQTGNRRNQFQGVCPAQEDRSWKYTYAALPGELTGTFILTSDAHRLQFLSRFLVLLV